MRQHMQLPHRSGHPLPSFLLLLACSPASPGVLSTCILCTDLLVRCVHPSGCPALATICVLAHIYAHRQTQVHTHVCTLQ